MGKQLIWSDITNLQRIIKHHSKLTVGQ